MNIIIPLCGKGERFLPDNKPFIKVFDNTILKYVVDSLEPTKNTIYIIVNDRTYHVDLEKYGIIINIGKETSGATETVYYGLQRQQLTGPFLIVDGDNFYSVDIVEKIRKTPDVNQVICFEDKGSAPIFSYVKFNEDGQITEIKEKERISSYANTGAYYFTSAERFIHIALQVIVNPKFHFKGEPYISSVISYMLSCGDVWKASPISSDSYYSLGTPKQVKDYKERTYCFLFDLDGTLVHTDKVYYKVWEKILKEYNIHLTDDIYRKFIYSNTDIYVKNSLLKNINITVDEIMEKKDNYFSNFIDDIEIVAGALEFMYTLKSLAHKISIVTNSNRKTAELIIHTIGVGHIIDHLVIGGECERAKPWSDPYLKAINYFSVDAKRCFIFEDSHNGLLSAKGSSPKCIVGIGGNVQGLISSGAQLIYRDYTEIKIDTLIDFKEENICQYKKYIERSLEKRYPGLTEISINPITLKGGFIADVYAVEFRHKTQSYSAIFKVENNNDSMLNKVAHDLDLYNRENYFYESISAYIPINIPQFYGLVRDDNYKVVGIMLEDLRKKDFHLGLDLNQEPVETSLAVIDNMAKMHAACWGKGLDTRFTELKKNNDTRFQPSWENFIEGRLEKFMEKWSHMFSECQRDNFINIGQSFSKIQNKLTEEPLTLVHGDVKSPNIFFRKMDEKVVPFFIDWQYICYGKGVQDLVFFMIESFTKESISRYFELFKNYYYIKLAEYGVKDYNQQSYNADFKYAAYYFPYFVAIWFGTTEMEDLIDVNFPYFFIDRLIGFYDLLLIQ
jgi:beta-phosphoglucomutase-like phosphatase (HAD superfamily)/choline kinase